MSVSASSAGLSWCVPDITNFDQVAEPTGAAADNGNGDAADDTAEQQQEQEEAEEEFASLMRPGVGHCLDREQNASDDTLFSIVCFSTGIELHPGQVVQRRHWH